MAANLKPLKAGSVFSHTSPSSWAVMPRSVPVDKVLRGGETTGHV